MTRKEHKETRKIQIHMEFLDCWTPLTYERYCNAYHGAYMGFITRKGVKIFKCG